VSDNIKQQADRLLESPHRGPEFLTLVANPPGAAGAVKLVADDGRSVWFQQDWDWPSVAMDFGWSTNHKPRRSTLEFNKEDLPCNGSRETDGTVKCPVCGKSASSFIYEARQFLDDADGQACENPGYDLGELPKPAASSAAPKTLKPCCTAFARWVQGGNSYKDWDFCPWCSSSISDRYD
jgi:hypothetical protein